MENTCPYYKNIYTPYSYIPKCSTCQYMAREHGHKSSIVISTRGSSNCEVKRAFAKEALSRSARHIPDERKKGKKDVQVSHFWIRECFNSRAFSFIDLLVRPLLSQLNFSFTRTKQRSQLTVIERTWISDDLTTTIVHFLQNRSS